MKTYIILAIVFIASFLSALILPINEALRGVAASPALLAMIGALFQLARDNAAHERSLELAQRQEVFSIGASSHMANIAFDNHVEFCNEYMQEVHQAVYTLFREGPTQKALDHAGELHRLREKYSAWLTDEINEELFPFEQALRSLGADQGFIDTTINAPQYDGLRVAKIHKVFEDFKKILTVGEGQKPDPHIATESVKKKIRSILGIEELVQLRRGLIAQAMSALESHNKGFNRTPESSAAAKPGWFRGGTG